MPKLDEHQQRGKKNLRLAYAVGNGGHECCNEDPCSWAGAWEFEGEDLPRCPVRHLDFKYSSMLSQYRLLKAQGILPGAGGWLDQTNKFTQMISYLSILEAEDDGR